MGKYEFGVVMTCQSCSNAVTRALGRVSGIKHADVSLQGQKVSVETEPSLGFDNVQAAIAKTGKKITYAKSLE